MVAIVADHEPGRSRFRAGETAPGPCEDGPVKFAEHIVDLVGDTPLVKLGSVTEGIAATVLAKIEYLNPGGSVKDRIALKMIEAAEASGELQPGGVIVEPTSGNTGVGLALVAQRRGYTCIFVCPDKVSEDKRNVLKAYGAEVVVCPTAVAPDHPDSYYSTSDRLMRETPGAWKPDQYSNPNGPLSHYETTGPEIWDDTDGRLVVRQGSVGVGVLVGLPRARGLAHQSVGGGVIGVGVVGRDRGRADDDLGAVGLEHVALVLGHLVG